MPRPHTAAVPLTLVTAPLRWCAALACGARFTAEEVAAALVAYPHLKRDTDQKTRKAIDSHYIFNTHIHNTVGADRISCPS